jgi:hypothetical protein
LLLICGLVPIFLDNNWTFLLLMAAVSISLFCAKENWIQ